MNFKQKVLEFVKSIPKGKVASYGQVAAASGSPRASRRVGGILGALGIDTNIPWWRVVNATGFISIKNHEVTKEMQKVLLEKDKVIVSKEFYVDMKKYQRK